MFRPGEVLVQKYGGSSLATPERILKVAERIADQIRAGRRVAIVVSATGDTTDDLITLLQQVNRDADARELDQLMATGEIASCSLMASALKRCGMRAHSFNAFNLDIQTDTLFGAAEIKRFGRMERLAETLRRGGVAVVAGFQGITPDGDLTTLGRGGSDITAVALARELGQKVCEKFTDEDGVYTADPRLVPTARKIWHLNYDEMETLAQYGNGILHPRSISYARAAGIRIHVRSSFSHEEGTLVGPDGDATVPVKSIACDRKQALVEIRGIPIPERPALPTGFRISAHEWIPAGTGRLHGRFAFKTADTFDALPELWSAAATWQADEVVFSSRLRFLTLVGCGFSQDASTAGQYQKVLEQCQIRPLLFQHDGLRVTVAVDEDAAETALQELHRSFP
ncbi:MAG TPA: aspartate kinase [Candidatus Ozemobacteraceae bacterium]|nr:aspartate kinase [Candidatus Ozemobacteraceae bacterium]